MAPLKILLVGMGRMGSLHLSHILPRRDVAIAGVVDPDPARLVGLNPAIPRGSSLEETGAWGARAAIVAAPTDVHAPTVLSLLDQGLHILVEKPMAHDMASAEEMVRSAQERGLTLMVGHIERHNRMVGALRKALEGEPKPRLIASARLAPRPGRIVGDGIILDSLIHDLDIVLGLLEGGLVLEEVTGTQGPDGAPDAARLTLSAGECHAHLFSSWRTERRHRTLTVLAGDNLYLGDYIAQSLQRVPLTGGPVRSLVAPEPGGEDSLDRQLSAFLESMGRPGCDPEPLDGLAIAIEATARLTDPRGV